MIFTQIALIATANLSHLSARVVKFRFVLSFNLVEFSEQEVDVRDVRQSFEVAGFTKPLALRDGPN